MRRWKHRWGEDDFATSSVGGEFWTVEETEYRKLERELSAANAECAVRNDEVSGLQGMLSERDAQIKELLQVLADEGRNIPHRYVEVDGICHRLLGTSSISAFERLERKKDKQIAALRGALQQSHDAMEAFTDPKGNMPERTGEFNDLKRALYVSRAALAAARKGPEHG